MQVAESCVVSIHYRLTNDRGEVLDSSEGREPLTYLQGRGNIIAGLENALIGKSAGDKLEVRVAPAEGYGERDAQLVQTVPRRSFQGVKDIQVGMRFTAQGPKGPQNIVVTRMASDMVTVDGNHPLAGEHLNFAVEITDVRTASEEELAHGHVHGPGGHHH